MLIKVWSRRNQALHLLLPRPLRNPPFQDAVEALDSSLFQRSACIIFLEEIPQEQIADKKTLLNLNSCVELVFPLRALKVLPCFCQSKHRAHAERYRHVRTSQPSRDATAERHWDDWCAACVALTLHHLPSSQPHLQDKHARRAGSSVRR